MGLNVFTSSSEKDHLFWSQFHKWMKNLFCESRVSKNGMWKMDSLYLYFQVNVSRDFLLCKLYLNLLPHFRDVIQNIGLFKCIISSLVFTYVFALGIFTKSECYGVGFSWASHFISPTVLFWPESVKVPVGKSPNQYKSVGECTIGKCQSVNEA